MSAFATSSHVQRKEYDVFISFRGSDIRCGFLSHLTERLQRNCIDAYIDERLERGDEISSALLEAIEGSIISLVIFSKDYASSKWCLEELVKIMECKQVKNQIVIPVFYNVDPSHVRHQEESYASAFTQHEQKFKDDLNKLQIWRSILKETADLSGYHSSNFLNESDLVDVIIKDVLKKLEGKDKIEVKQWLIGFEENLATVESFMKVDSQEVGVLGFWGKGGIGKTTLARAIFDKFSRQFDSSFFASNVREESKRIGLTCLLEKILSGLLNNESLIMKGRPNIQRRLRRIRVLLVLDDVDTSSQLQYLIEENLSFGPSSKVIITSRDRHILVSGGVHVLNEVKELNMEESLQLFCRHAFKQAYPKMGYEKLSAQAIQYARGLPLALKVLGSYLNSRDTTTWESALKRFRKYPHMEIQTVLRVSYDGLDIPEKRIFLDVAFFFKGEKKEDIIRVLDACDFYAYCGIDSLLDKALITISRDNRVEIHDLLQEMAEKIVREESIEHPERRSRLNDAKEIRDVLKNNEGTDGIEGIVLDIENTLSLSADTFKKMRNLRFLKIKTDIMKIDPDFGDHHTVHLPDGLHSLSNKLCYFCWQSYPLESLPSGFCPEQLVEIHLERSKIKKLWDGVQDLMNLKIINLSFSRGLEELPDFSMAQNLETVDLAYCERLYSIHPSILSLPKLVYLNLRSCRKLKNLHGKKHLKSLKYLILSRCYSLKEFLLSSDEMTSLDLDDTGIKTLKLPIGRFKKLEELNLSELLSFQINELSCLTSLKIFSLSEFKREIHKSKLLTLFDAWHSLEELRLRNCVVDEIPDNINGLSSLKILSLRGCTVKSLPNSIKQLSELKQIDLGECKRLRSLPELPPSITHFYFDECTSLETIDFTLMPTICNNSCEVKVCYPGSTIPKGFNYSQTAKSSITIELAPSSSDHLLGFASCCILSACEINTSAQVLVCRRFHFEDEEINRKDEKRFPGIWILNTDHVYVWYDPMERILKETQRRQFDKGTTSKFACEFFMGYFYDVDRSVGFDHHIKACGIWPIYASEVQQMELKMEVTVTSNTSGFNENPNAEVAQYQPAPYSIRRSTWDLGRMMSRFLRTKSSRDELTVTKDI